MNSLSGFTGARRLLLAPLIASLILLLAFAVAACEAETPVPGADEEPSATEGAETPADTEAPEPTAGPTEVSGLTAAPVDTPMPVTSEAEAPVPVASPTSGGCTHGAS